MENYIRGERTLKTVVCRWRRVLPARVTPKMIAAGGTNFGLAIGNDGKFYAWGSGPAVNPSDSALGHAGNGSPTILSFMSHISQLAPPGYVPKPVSFVQTAKPITRTYPGVDASILGIRTGMTVSHVEAIAAMRGLGNPSRNETQVSLHLANVPTLSGKPLEVHSKEYTYHLGFLVQDKYRLDVSFSSPATGNRSDAITLNASYPSDPKLAPLTVNGLATNLLYRYGPPSLKLQSVFGQFLWWDFDKQSLLKTCNGKIACFPHPREFLFSSILANDTQQPNEISAGFLYCCLDTPEQVGSPKGWRTRSFAWRCPVRNTGSRCSNEAVNGQNENSCGERHRGSQKKCGQAGAREKKDAAKPGAEVLTGGAFIARGALLVAPVENRMPTAPGGKVPLVGGKEEGL